MTIEYRSNVIGQLRDLARPIRGARTSNSQAFPWHRITFSGDMIDNQNGMITRLDDVQLENSIRTFRNSPVLVRNFVDVWMILYKMWFEKQNIRFRIFSITWTILRGSPELAACRLHTKWGKFLNRQFFGPTFFNTQKFWVCVFDVSNVLLNFFWTWLIATLQNSLLETNKIWIYKVCKQKSEKTFEMSKQ